ncbi:Ger(x)C family spore germination protein [Gottfriedia luciferensis]|uniref:Ger(x)C family spore germination protein n=1 Tax=Gottfriedia luciferensis TaxID=178774 RepID=UPI000B44E9DB|nr:Ger(x)C family spore germination protein [Gottfriedia luciferensis]
MKKALMLIFLLPILTGCWDRLPLKKLHLVDVNGFDLNEKTNEVEALFLITKLKSAGQGTGEPISVMKKLKGPTLAESISEWENFEQSPFIGISTRVYLMSQNFASHDPVSELDFVLDAPYSSINTPLIVIEGNLSELLETSAKENTEFSKELDELILSMEENRIIPTVSMMNFIQSRDEPLADLALPVFKELDSNLELDGALLYRNGNPTGKKLETEQVKMMMLLLGGNVGRQRFTGNFAKQNTEKSLTENANKINYGFTIKKNNTKFNLANGTKKLPKITLSVNLKVYVFELGKGKHGLKPDYAHKMEKKLNKHFEELAADTIKIMQTANSDPLGIGMQIRAYHPKVWKSLNWRKDYPKMSIEPKFDIKFLNS